VPFGALVSTCPAKLSTPLLDVSTNPPEPDGAPPPAKIVPANVVAVSDHTMTLPPLPLPVADALIVVAASTLTVVAVGMA